MAGGKVKIFGFYNNKQTKKRAFLLHLHQQKHPLRWVRTGWVVTEFVDVTKMWVNLCLFKGAIWQFNPFPFSNVSFAPTFFYTHSQISPTCRIHLLVDFVSPTDFFCFTHLQISPICRLCFHPPLFPVSTTCRFHQLVDLINFQISPSFT